MIMIDENYRIEVDEYCFILAEKKTSKKSEVERWEKLTFHNRIEGALMGYRRRVSKKTLGAGEVSIEDTEKLLRKLDDEMLVELKEVAKLILEGLRLGAVTKQATIETGSADK